MSSGRYQSRLFNLVHLQSRRLTAYWERTLRHLQVTTQWSMEVLLYPIYLLWQSTDTVVKKLSSPAPSSQPQLPPHSSDLSPQTPPPADTAIQHILEVVQSLPSEGTTFTSVSAPKLFQYLESLWTKFIPHSTNKLSVAQRVNVSVTPGSQNNDLKRQLTLVRGIATNLGDRHLVLVSNANEIIDILTPSQQAKLSTKIFSELAQYSPDLQLTKTQSTTNWLSGIERVIDKLTGSNSAKIPVLNAGINQDYTNKFITSLDTAIAQLEDKTIVPSQEIVRVTQTHLKIFIYGKEQLVARGDIAVSNVDLAEKKLNISALIAAAINYFFGVGKSKNLNARGAKGKFITQQDTLLSNSNSEAWLSWSDLYGNTATLAEETTPPLLRINPAIAPLPSAGLSWGRKLPFPPPKTNSNLVPRKKQPSHLARIRKTSGKITNIKPTETNISPWNIDSEQSGEQPDWIETKATPVGYEKHFLERILEWLDRAMLWLEEMVVKIFQRLQSLWRGK